jgi:hypothetical protein
MAASLAQWRGGRKRTACSAGADPRAGKGKPHEDPPTDMARAMERWQAVSTPGDQHAYLDRFVGDWDAVSKMWMEGPDKPPVVFEIHDLIYGESNTKAVQVDYTRRQN